VSARRDRPTIPRTRQRGTLRGPTLHHQPTNAIRTAAQRATVPCRLGETDLRYPERASEGRCAYQPSTTNRQAQYARRLREPQYRVGSERPTYHSPNAPARDAAGTKPPPPTDKRNTHGGSESHSTVSARRDRPTIPRTRQRGTQLVPNLHHPPTSAIRTAAQRATVPCRLGETDLRYPERASEGRSWYQTSTTHRQAQYARRLREPQYRVGSERPTYCSPNAPARDAADTNLPPPTDKPNTHGGSESHSTVSARRDRPTVARTRQRGTQRVPTSHHQPTNAIRTAAQRAAVPCRLGETDLL
jgi:hypothetical protein